MEYLLCIDIGNTNVVAALLKGEAVTAEIRIASSPLQMQDEYRIAISGMLSRTGLKASALCGSVISSVVPRLTTPFTEVCRQIIGREPLIVDPFLPLNLKIRYDDPSEVGADRICNAAGALRLYAPPLIVVDMGTATTFDIVSGDREYLGGLIMP
ncbi:MAG: type III pantothenate kinase, partial [Candidatus Neomarinimicrobiota bacterium]